jgi:hypothetical protein
MDINNSKTTALTLTRLVTGDRISYASIEIVFEIRDRKIAAQALASSIQ